MFADEDFLNASFRALCSTVHFYLFNAYHIQDFYKSLEMHYDEGHVASLC